PGEEAEAPRQGGCRQQFARRAGIEMPARPNAPVAPDPGAGAADGAAPAGIGMPAAPLPRPAQDGPGQQGPIDSLRMEAVGRVAELTPWIGGALAQGLCPRLMAELPVVQRELIQLAANLAFSEEEAHHLHVQKVQARQVARLEDVTDELNQEVEPLDNF